MSSVNLSPEERASFAEITNNVMPDWPKELASDRLRKVSLQLGVRAQSMASSVLAGKYESQDFRNSRIEETWLFTKVLAGTVIGSMIMSRTANPMEAINIVTNNLA